MNMQDIKNEIRCEYKTEVNGKTYYCLVFEEVDINSNRRRIVMKSIKDRDSIKELLEKIDTQKKETGAEW